MIYGYISRQVRPKVSEAAVRAVNHCSGFLFLENGSRQIQAVICWKTLSLPVEHNETDLKLKALRSHRVVVLIPTTCTFFSSPLILEHRRGSNMMLLIWSQLYDNMYQTGLCNRTKKTHAAHIM